MKELFRSKFIIPNINCWSPRGHGFWTCQQLRLSTRYPGHHQCRHLGAELVVVVGMRWTASLALLGLASATDLCSQWHH